MQENRREFEEFSGIYRDRECKDIAHGEIKSAGNFSEKTVIDLYKNWF
jgi:hypothetical protein